MPSEEICYPTSDGRPKADSTLQFAWMVHFYNNLSLLLHHRTAFLAIDLLWYPVEGGPRIVTAPDVLVALGRPEGHRGSYQQWKEDNQPPQVVIEVLSPSNTPMEMMGKIAFYDRHGVEECLVIDPDRHSLKPYVREEGKLVTPDFPPARWQSPRLGITLETVDGELKAYLPDGSPFRSFNEIKEQAAAAEAEIERLRAKLREAGLEE